MVVVDGTLIQKLLPPDTSLHVKHLKINTTIWWRTWGIGALVERYRVYCMYGLATWTIPVNIFAWHSLLFVLRCLWQVEPDYLPHCHLVASLDPSNKHKINSNYILHYTATVWWRMELDLLEPTQAKTIGTTSKHQRVTWPGLYRKLIEFLRIVVCLMILSTHLLEVTWLSLAKAWHNKKKTKGNPRQARYLAWWMVLCMLSVAVLLDAAHWQAML